MTGIAEVAQVVFVRRSLVEIQYLRTTLTNEPREEFGRRVEGTVRRIESADFLPRSGVGFPAESAQQLSLRWPLSRKAGEQKILVGLTSLITRNPPMPPKFSRTRALFSSEQNRRGSRVGTAREIERDTKFVELGRYLCEVRAGQYWRLETLKSFDEFLERRLPGSRRKAYYLMSIHEHLPPQARKELKRKELKKIGWAKGIELANANPNQPAALRRRLHFFQVPCAPAGARFQRSSTPRTRFSHNHGKPFQAPQSKGGSPLGPRVRELHLRKALHQIQDRNLPL